VLLTAVARRAKVVPDPPLLNHPDISQKRDMQLAKVIGDVVSTRKDETLTAVKLLILQPLAADGSAAGRTLVALDSVGAGTGETVFFVRGKEASFPFYPAEPPTDASVVGIVDRWDTE